MIIRIWPSPDDGWPEWRPPPTRVPRIAYVIGFLPFVAWVALFVWLVL